MPAVLVGIGGMGGDIVSQVRTQIDVRVKSASYRVAAQERADQFQYLLVDTRHEPYHGNFQPGEIFVVPEGLKRFQINHLVDKLIATSRDVQLDDDGDSISAAPGTFADWWVTVPREGNPRGIPYLPGDFASGAGQVRAKGKLGYVNDLMSSGPRIVSAVDEKVKYLQRSRNELLNNEDRKIYVYLVCSLGGGTGSGIVLTLAQQLRDILPPQCALIGVFLMASITELAAGGSYRESIQANTAAAIAEIDFWQTPRHKRTLLENKLTPFLDWRGPGKVITGVTEPFELAYLFTFGNRDDRNIVRASDYKRYIAECISTELYSDLDSLVAGQHSNFIQMFDGIMIGDRTGRYASAGLATVRVPVERITQHLSRRFGSSVLADRLLKETPESKKSGEEFIDQVIDDLRLFWTRNDMLSGALLEATSDDEPAPTIPILNTDTFKEAGRDETRTMVRKGINRYNEWREQTLIPHVRSRHSQLLAAAKVDTVDKMARLLARNDGDGFECVRKGVVQGKKIIDDEIKVLRQVIDGDEEAIVADGGLTKLVADRQVEAASIGDSRADREAAAFKRLLRKRLAWKWSSRKPKQTFITSWWKPFVEDEQRLIVAREARQLLMEYNQFLTELDQHLNLMATTMSNMADEFKRLADADLGKKVDGAGVLDASILDDVALVDHAFSTKLANLVSHSAVELIREITNAPAGLIASMKVLLENHTEEMVRRDFATDLRHSLLQAGRDQFEGDVKALSVWDALLREMELREKLGRVDATLARALEAVDKQQKLLESNGLTMETSDIKREKLAKFAAAKLKLAQENASPLWNMDNVEISVGLLDRANITVLAFDQAEYQAFCHRHGMDESLKEGVENELDIDSSNAVGKHTISIYRREGRLPISHLNPSELSKMKNAFDSMKNQKPLFTDRRYDALVDDSVTKLVQLTIDTSQSPNGSDPTETRGEPVSSTLASQPG